MGDVALTLTFRPDVAMHQITCLPHVVALALARALPGCAVRWPYDVCMRESGESVCTLTSRAGYDGSMFCTVEICGLAEGEQGAKGVIQARVDSWAKWLSGRPRMAPLAGVLEDYADALWRLGEDVSVLYPNGAPFERGTFAGIDVWGRASVRLQDGQVLEFGPERYIISS